MADGKISSMIVATETKTTDLFEISQLVGGTGSERVTRANDLQSIALFLHDVMQNSALTTTEKTLVGAINEVGRFKPGDLLTLPRNSTTFGGYISNSNKRVYLTIPLAKEKTDNAQVSLVGSFAVRTIAGSQAVIDASQAACNMYANMLVINYQSDTELFPMASVPNNSPVSVTVYSDTAGEGLTINFS